MVCERGSVLGALVALQHTTSPRSRSMYHRSMLTGQGSFLLRKVRPEWNGLYEYALVSHRRMNLYIHLQGGRGIGASLFGEMVFGLLVRLAS